MLLVVLHAAAAPAFGQSAAPESKPPGLGEVFGAVPLDLWRFISLDTAIVLGLGGTAAATGHLWDDDLADELEVNVSLNDAMEPGHTYGAFSFQAVIGVGLYATGRVTHHSKLAVTGADIMRAQILSQAYVQVLKYTVQRERPNGSNTQSFPSGHSASAFATAAVLQRHYGWKLGVPATLVAAYVATARVHDNKHYLSDVIFGGAMGIASARTVTLRGRRYTGTIAPSLGKGRVGVVVSIDLN
jgi:membrane-associated phospholipid phosphatase